MPSDACAAVLAAGDGLASTLLDDELKLFECQPFGPRARRLPLLPEARVVINQGQSTAIKSSRGQSRAITCSTLSDAAASVFLVACIAHTCSLLVSSHHSQPPPSSSSPAVAGRGSCLLRLQAASVDRGLSVWARATPVGAAAEEAAADGA